MYANLVHVYLSILKTQISDSPQEKHLYNDELDYNVE